MMNGQLLSVVIPTFGRERVLVDTVLGLQALSRAPGEVILVDQTPAHDAATTAALSALQHAGRLRWLRLDSPSIPRAMNVGLQAATHSVVLFLDDDIVPSPDLIAAHLASHVDFPEASAVVGQVLQPDEESACRNGWRGRDGLLADLDFPFWSNERAWISNVMAGNLSVKRQKALDVGGFDESFEGAAYRFETEFARRLVRSGGRILFEPAASIRHLRAERGGTRSTGSHLTSASPVHGMGDYYFALRSGLSWETAAYMLRRPFREVRTKFHLRHPWYIPVKLIGEARGAVAAWRRWRRKPRLIAGEPD